MPFTVFDAELAEHAISRPHVWSIVVSTVAVAGAVPVAGR
jgi:hypothetical protein